VQQLQAPGADPPDQQVALSPPWKTAPFGAVFLSAGPTTGVGREAW